MIRKLNGPGLWLAGASLIAGTVAVWMSQDFRDVSRWFPMYTGISVVVLSVAVLPWEVGFVHPRTAAQEDDGDTVREAFPDFARYMGWLIALPALMGLVGMTAAVFLWVAGFRRVNGGASWKMVLISAIGAVVGVVAVSMILNLRMPGGLLLPSMPS